MSLLNLCKDYAFDTVKCKNLKYETDQFPEWDCDFKFKVSNISMYTFDVLYDDYTYNNTGEVKEYCYVKDSPYLDYTLDYLQTPNNPKSNNGFGWTWVIVVGSILAIVGILVGLVMFTEKGRNMLNSFKAS